MAQERMSAEDYLKSVVPSESSEQIKLMTFVRTHVSAFSWHTRNEGQRPDLGRMRDALEGMWSGVADVFGIVEAGPHALRPFAIELKRIDGRESDVSFEQRRFGRMCEERGGLWTWAAGAEEAKAWCHQVGIVRPHGWVAPWAERREEYGI